MSADGATNGRGTAPLDPERARMADAGHLEEGLESASPWYLWGPYLAERAWGSVREDYSADGDAWSYFPHDHARSRAYRWNEDGMAGISDVLSRLCLSLALWNGRDPILKERMFGLANAEGNHGEDAKDYWWYLDALPSSVWLRWRYHYPQQAFPYDDLVRTNRDRSKLEREYELLDTGVFDAGYWVVGVDYAKADPTYHARVWVQGKFAKGPLKPEYDLPAVLFWQPKGKAVYPCWVLTVTEELKAQPLGKETPLTLLRPVLLDGKGKVLHIMAHKHWK